MIRRFRYDPPAGWRARARGELADWYPPGLPREFTVICVWPALGRVPVDAELVEGLLAGGGWQVTRRRPPVPVRSAHALAGLEWPCAGHANGTPSRRLLALLEDQRFLYPLRLEAGFGAGDASEEVFRRVVRSVRPVP